MICLLQTETADTAHTGVLQVQPGPFPDFTIVVSRLASPLGVFFVISLKFIAMFSQYVTM